MEVKKIYQHKSKDIDSEIFELVNGRLVIKHSNSQTEKLNIDQWEEINYIPDDYSLVERELSRTEKNEIKKYLAAKPGLAENKSLPGRLINKLKNIFVREG